MGFIDFIWTQYLKLANSEISDFCNQPVKTQEAQLLKIIHTAKDTEFGIKYLFEKIDSTDQWRKTIPLHEYDDLKSDIQRMMTGEKNILWPGRTFYFAKSSGTTSDKSKYIPITPESHKECHTKAGLRLMASIYSEFPECGILDGKSIILAGSARNDLIEYPDSVIGDVSAVIYKKLSSTLKSFLVPKEEFNLLEDSEAKLDVIAEQSLHADIRFMAGSPTWMSILCKKLLLLSGKSNILEIWPNFKILVHGAVSFLPYKKTFEEFFPSKSVSFFETYNASEGYFAVQDRSDSDGMLLLLDVGIFYEFIPLDELDSLNPKSLFLNEVSLQVNYALIITSNSGLYRYIIGDTIMFTSLSPYRIKITGRTKQFINVFGEELMVSNTDEAIKKTSDFFNVKVKDYTVGPVFQDNHTKGGHEWIIEFEKNPDDPELFAEKLDQVLQSLNSDYEAKRFKNLALNRLKLNVASAGCFANWMKATNRIGAQKKVPRLSNNRQFLEEILNYH